MKIGEFSKQTGVSQRMIRYFESMGLISPGRIGSYREYGPDDKELVFKIKKFQEQGLSLKEVRNVIEGSDELLEKQLLESFSRNRNQIKDIESKNLMIWESLQSLKLGSSKEVLVREGVIMEFVKSFEEKNIIKGRMPYLEIFYETYVHLSGQHWDHTPLKILHSTDLVHIGEELPKRNAKDLKVLISSDELQFRNAFVFFLSPELLKEITGVEVDILKLEDEKELNLKITKWVDQALKTFNNSWGATFSYLNLENYGMLKNNTDINKLYHNDEIFILTNLYTEDEKHRFSIGLPYRFVSVVYNLLKR